MRMTSQGLLQETSCNKRSSQDSIHLNDQICGNWHSPCSHTCTSSFINFFGSNTFSVVRKIVSEFTVGCF